MTCPELPIEDLVAHQDGELAPAASARVEEHLGRCAVCRADAEALRRMERLLDALPGRAAPAGFAERVSRHASDAEIEAATDDIAAPAGRLALFAVRRLAIAAAVLVAVGGLAVWLASRPGAAIAPDGVLTAAEEQAIADDLFVLSNLDALENAQADEIAEVVDDLDLLEALGADDPLADENGKGG